MDSEQNVHIGPFQVLEVLEVLEKESSIHTQSILSLALNQFVLLSLVRPLGYE